MIGMLRGTLAEQEGNLLLVDCGGVGYEVLVPESLMPRLPRLGEPVRLVTRLVVREDDQTLYGFGDALARRVFDLLTGVSGCGPKSALSLLALGEAEVGRAVATGDVRTLARAQGVGPKLAQRIVVDLKDKITHVTGQAKLNDAVRQAEESDDLVEALLALGYRRQEAEGAAEKARGQTDGLTAQIRVATGILRGKRVD